jgi:hypothetical protein
MPLLRKDIEVFEQWIAAGKDGAGQCHPSAVCHLGDDPVLCDFSAQMALVLNRKQLTEGFRRCRTSHRRHGAGGDQRAAGRWRRALCTTPAGQQHGIGFRFRHWRHKARHWCRLEEVIGVDCTEDSPRLSTTTLPLMTPLPPLTVASGAHIGCQARGCRVFGLRS